MARQESTGILGFMSRLLDSRKLGRPESLDDIRRLAWQQLELFLGEAFRRRGYSVVPNRGGVDLVLHKDGEEFYAQCKQWKVLKVGVKPLRELFDAISAGGVAGGFFVTSGVYTEEARTFAKESAIELIDGIALERMVKEAQSPEPFLDPTAGRRPLHTTFTTPSTAPSCPLCKAVMVRKSAKSGANAGAELWGCSRHPQCRGTRAV